LITERRSRIVGLLGLAVLAPIAGAASGLVGAIFRLTLEQADRARDAVIAASHGHGIAGFLLVCSGTAATVALAAWLVRRFSPYAAGTVFRMSKRR
jgi:CIC family chloride channel protein